MTQRLIFNTGVLGPLAAFRLGEKMVTQTIRSGAYLLVTSILSGEVTEGDRIDIILDGTRVGPARISKMDSILWQQVDSFDAQRQGFDTTSELGKALQRAGFRFKPLERYVFYRILFSWLEVEY